MKNSIELIKSRLSKVTQGKWEWVEYSEDPCKMPVLKSDVVKIMDFGDAENYYPSEGTPPNKHDAEFIVNAKSDIEFLLNENESLKDEFKSIAKLYNEFMNTEQLSALSFIYEIGEILSKVGVKNE